MYALTVSLAVVLMSVLNFLIESVFLLLENFGCYDGESKISSSYNISFCAYLFDFSLVISFGALNIPTLLILVAS